MKTNKAEKCTNVSFPIQQVFGAVLGTLIYCIGVNMFIVPSGLYSGGLMGAAQIVRTLLAEHLNFSVEGIDLSGILYYLINIPILITAWIKIDRWFVLRTLITVSCMSLFLSVIPAVRLLPGDTIACCLVGGVISGIGVGLALRNSATLGGMDVLSMIIIRKFPQFSVGKLSLALNFVVYGSCMLLFDAPTAIYSVVYAAIYSTAMDHIHTQNIDVEVTIFTKQPVGEINQKIFEELHRGVTKVRGTGAYTSDDLNVLYIALSQYEVPLLRHIVQRYDPNAFVIVKDHVKVYGNYQKHL